MADATRLNFDAPRPVEATPAPSVAPLFAATPRATVTPDAPLFADSVRRHRLAVTIDQLRLACGAEVDERVLTDAAAALRYVRAEALTPMAAADVGVEPQAAFAAIADDLISLGTAAATADVGRDVEELAAAVDGFAHWWTPTPPPERLARVRAVAERLRDAVPRLDALATDVAAVRSRVDAVIHDLMVQLAVLAYLRNADGAAGANRGGGRAGRPAGERRADAGGGPAGRRRAGLGVGRDRSAPAAGDVGHAGGRAGVVRQPGRHRPRRRRPPPVAGGADRGSASGGG